MKIAEHVILAISLVFSLFLVVRQWRVPALFTRAKALILAVDQLRDELEMERRKSAEFFKKIAEVLAERDEWRGWYQRQASQHSHAQGYLLHCLEALAVEYHRATGKRAPLDRGAAELVTHFSTEHAAAIEAVDKPPQGSVPQPLQTDLKS